MHVASFAWMQDENNWVGRCELSVEIAEARLIRVLASGAGLNAGNAQICLGFARNTEDEIVKHRFVRCALVPLLRYLDLERKDLTHLPQELGIPRNGQLSGLLGRH